MAVKLNSIILKLQELQMARHPGDPDVVLIVNGVAYPVDQIWWEPGQNNGQGAICMGDDPR